MNLLLSMPIRRIGAAEV